MTTDSFTIRSIEAFCYRYPLATPVVTSFGKMLNRPAVFVRAVDEDGVEGWGEAWSNFPAPGAEHRARLVNEVLAPGLVGRRFDSPAQAFEVLSKGTEVLALQCGEPGPFAQAISGIDLALWDLSARRQRLPLWRLLGGQSRRIKVYASGINPGGAAQTAEAALARGHRALKLKVGFGAETDLANLAALRAIVGAGMLAADANQGWSVDQALEMLPRLAAFYLRWLEEPIRADRPREEWRRLRAAAKMPIAAGENISSVEGFKNVLAEDVLGVVQPDIAKWGGLSACAGVAHDILKAGKTFCPHYLGGGIGLLASAHLLAGIGGDGWLEVDANDNPLRDRFCGAVANVTDGTIVLGEEPGLGFTPDLSGIANYRSL
ncbi:D-galactarolactone cycloisomerase [Bradyrhizobium japonicum]|jgi:L-alanine-DL-glutamate epimerase-like enolase superfamily enzyme|uniref:mandelate racemase/muconate lactonizing enzyme family protein n=1 Tax=Bradyrhizobium TaxID=374 RepID=UPI0003F9AC4E|nr:MULTISPECIES: mandelate racemase/muconate lactonizing enzyme family protein [Bradyrhizobium]MBR0879744.1 mandelate racemase/muconate lactonizing enzyme family protein [Bradyrhizobium liaoningense]MBR0942431.1 mandelate racemase/muconate lactonizing enzyme family protein [Bradyrhizobium liaoningense]MBR0999748.1 mandelate racemase/muconate lactonizing enzyme family protein [Bradyrhizobium liaoningense]MBR1026452.1 mandelate racemase/muconate lactonizing enzyme family protein [Bradyrhizobium l